ncbi:MAG TPA: DUF1559 domain-containing protein, partial [Pirellulales bacterium]
QIGLALNNFHSIQNKLPAGTTTNSFIGPNVFLLPHLELTNIYSLIPNPETGALGASSGTPWSLYKPAVFICPSDSEQGDGAVMGYSNYRYNSGSWAQINKWDGVFGMGQSSNGSPAEIVKGIKFAAILDGTSNTAAAAEGCNFPQSGPNDALGDCFEAGTVSDTTIAAARTTLLGKNWRTSTLAAGSWRGRGYAWDEGSMWRGLYNHILPPNSPCWRPGQYGLMAAPASSRHPGGANVVMCDGAVRFVVAGVDPDTWTAAGTRKGVEALILP